MKTIRTVWVSAELWEKAKQKGINISREVEKLLQQLVGEEEKCRVMLHYDNVVPRLDRAKWRWLEMLKDKYLRLTGKEPLTNTERTLLERMVNSGRFRPQDVVRRWLKGLYRDLEKMGISGMDFRAWVAGKLNDEQLELRWLKRAKRAK